MMFLADFMGCNDQKSSRNGIFVTRNNLGSLYTSFSWVLELIGNLRRNYESVPVFALRGLSKMQKCRDLRILSQNQNPVEMQKSRSSSPQIDHLLSL